jgi:beta-galactosidase
VVYVEATIVDANGIIVPSASDLITFKATGPGSVVAVDSGDNASHEPFQATERRAYQGRCFALLKASAPRGRINVTATATGLAPGTAFVEAAAPSALHIGSRQTNR